MTKNESGTEPLNVYTVVLFTLVVQKLFGAIAWSWWWVSAPIWVAILIYLAVRMYRLIPRSNRITPPTPSEHNL
ncbi:hypothetical protein [Pseudomonas sp. GV071]|uniref:hypothetical protein n=1 Tax=Pseudomonas sp. GV071 TaxID=2135754 RepID=UPI000D371D60|nr:hypothetical protein [Pseudomonas sp. GV071]PTQ70382.1 hypothetical protein C8K61_106104 [Pseudomonas sp. GV071]